MPNAAGQPVVFISYAHESDAFRDQVKALADWLASQGCELLTDHPYRHRPPSQGWQAWMLHCIQQADTVLVVGSPKLRARVEKTAPPGSGQGATYEGAIVTQDIYDASMKNDKFYPVLPDSGDYDHIPTVLRAWWSNHRYPSDYVGIRALIFGGHDMTTNKISGATATGDHPVETPDNGRKPEPSQGRRVAGGAGELG